MKNLFEDEKEIENVKKIIAEKNMQDLSTSYNTYSQLCKYYPGSTLDENGQHYFDVFKYSEEEIKNLKDLDRCFIISFLLLDYGILKNNYNIFSLGLGKYTLLPSRISYNYDSKKELYKNDADFVKMFFNFYQYFLLYLENSKSLASIENILVEYLNFINEYPPNNKINKFLNNKIQKIYKRQILKLNLNPRINAFKITGDSKLDIYESNAALRKNFIETPFIIYDCLCNSEEKERVSKIIVAAINENFNTRRNDNQKLPFLLKKLKEFSKTFSYDFYQDLLDNAKESVMENILLSELK